MDAAAPSPSPSAPAANNGHPSLQEIIQHNEREGATQACQCHNIYYDKTDIPRSGLTRETKVFLQDVEPGRLVVEKSAEGVGEMRVELWTTSASAMTKCHLRYVIRLDKLQVATEERELADPVLDLVMAPLSASQFQDVRSQLRRRVRSSYLREGLLGLLEDIFIFHT